MTVTSALPAYIFLAPFTGMLVLPFLGKKESLLRFFSVSFLAAAAFFSIRALFLVGSGNAVSYHLGGWAPPFGIAWRLDSLSALMAVLVSCAACAVTGAGGLSVTRNVKGSPLVYYMTVLLHVTALLGMILTHDLFNLFVFIEVSSLTAYALIATGDDKKGNISSFRYLIVGTIAASFYLLGVGYLYSATGTLNMSDMAARIQSAGASRSLLLGIFFILIGMAIKMGLFPFHAWMPDAYTHASDAASCLVAPLMTKTAVYAVIRIFWGVLGPQFLEPYGVFPILSVLGVLGLVAGAVMAFVQTNFKRMLAYSSVSHIGLIALAIGMNHPGALVGALLHVVSHAVMKAVLFLCAASFYDRFAIREISDFSKLRGRLPIVLTGLTAAALSMTGIPPFAGFFSKWYILSGAAAAGQGWAVWAVGFSSLLSGLYFFKVLEKIFFTKNEEPAVEMGHGSAVLEGTILAGAVLLAVLGFFSPQIYSWGLQVLVSRGGI